MHTMSRIDKGFTLATEAAQLAAAERYYRVGAALFLGSRLISIGWNQKKSHPEQMASPFNWQHAELNCLLGTSKRDLTKSVMYVARVTPGGHLRISKPCADCQRILRAAGVRHVYYINRESNRDYMKLSEQSGHTFLPNIRPYANFTRD